MRMMNELRRDYFTGRWSIVATERAYRPNDFNGPNQCPFCPGAEHMTPPSKASYFSLGDSVLIRSDIDGVPPHTGWSVRVIPNMFPAVTHCEACASDGRTMSASGIHEVIVESPAHDRHPQHMEDREIRLLFDAYRDRYAMVAKIPYVRYVSLFRNYGKEAGASLSHPHSQAIALPLIPEIIKEQYGLDYSSVIKEEEMGPRVVLSTPHTVAFTPYASAYPYEVWVFPRKRHRNIVRLSDEERSDLAVCTRDVLGKISAIHNDPPYNYCFVQSPQDDVYMHLRIIPKLGTGAGFELNTDMHINSTPPEEAAKKLREAPVYNAKAANESIRS